MNKLEIRPIGGKIEAKRKTTSQIEEMAKRLEPRLLETIDKYRKIWN